MIPDPTATRWAKLGFEHRQGGGEPASVAFTEGVQGESYTLGWYVAEKGWPTPQAVGLTGGTILGRTYTIDGRAFQVIPHPTERGSYFVVPVT